MAAGVSALVGAILAVLIAGSCSGAAVATTAPVYSATGVCVAGTPEFAFSFTGFPVGQTTAVSLYLYDGPETTGTQIANVGSTGIETVLWNPRSSDFGPGSHVIAAHIGSSGISALNLTPVPNWPITNSYNVTLPHCGSGTPSFVGLASTPDSGGYWQTTSDGQVLAFGDARWFGSMSGTPLNHPIIGIAATPDGGGYWLVASDGGVFAFGDAQFHGSAGGIRLNKPVVGIAATGDGDGYYLVASDGGVFAYGDGVFQGSTGSLVLNKPVVGMALDQTSGGYWLVASDGGVFSFGASFHGSTGGLALNGPVVAMESESDAGYRLVASDGGVFPFGSDTFVGSRGSTSVPSPIVGLTATNNDAAYTMLGADGTIYTFGNAGDYGTVAGSPGLQ